MYLINTETVLKTFVDLKRKLNYNPICFSGDLLRGVTLASVAIEGCPETEPIISGEIIRLGRHN